MSIGLLPTDFRFQPIDPGGVADRLVDGVAAGPGGRLSDLSGPEVRTLGELAKIWLTARRIERRLVRVPLPGKMADAFRRGLNTVPAQANGKVTWAEWVSRKYTPVLQSLDGCGREWKSVWRGYKRCVSLPTQSSHGQSY